MRNELYKVYGTVDGVEWLLGTITCKMNAYTFALSMRLIYADVRIFRGKTEVTA